MLGDLATENGRDFVWLANGAIGVEKPLSERIQRGGGARRSDCRKRPMNPSSQ
jgi:hypothetical protein